MPEPIIPQSQIKALEVGLKKMKQANLLHHPEMSTMYQVISSHHNEVKLAHLTGKPPDIMQQAKQDTKFFYILVRMLGEVLNSCEKSEQKSQIKQVYNWYLGNKHTLHTGPRFGRAKSAEAKRGILKSPSLSEFGSFSSQKEEILTQGSQDDSAVSSRPQVPSLDKRSSSCDPQEHLLPKRKAYPLSHLYNPHSQDNPPSTAPPATNAGVTRIRMGESKPEPAPGHDDARRKWDSYLQEQNYGQDLLAKLQYVGRSGVPGSLRYAAHDQGVAAEMYTQDVIMGYAARETQKSQPEPITADPHKLLDSDLEDFYKNTEGHYPASSTKYPSFKGSRTMSAPPRQPLKEQQPQAPSRTGSARSLPNPPLASQKPNSAFKDIKDQTDSGWASRENVGSDVKLDTMVRMIDSVTEEMTEHKEKLAPDPQPGFRQPTMHVDPDERPTTAPSMGAIARPSSPAPINVDPLPITAPAAVSYEERPRSALDLAIDWRGSVTPSAARQRHQALNFGNHTYVQQMPRSRSSMRSAGSTLQGQSRPRTAPFFPPEMDPGGSVDDTDDLSSMITVHHLGGKKKRKKRYRYLGDDYDEYKNWKQQNLYLVETAQCEGMVEVEAARYEQTLPTPSLSIRPVKTAGTQRDYPQRDGSPPTMEYLTFIDTKPLDSRATSGSGMRGSDSGMASMGGSAHHPSLPFEGHERSGDEDDDSMMGDLDMGDINDLEDELKGHWENEDEQREVATPVPPPPKASGINYDFNQSRRLIDEIASLVHDTEVDLTQAEDKSKNKSSKDDEKDVDSVEAHQASVEVTSNPESRQEEFFITDREKEEEEEEGDAAAGERPIITKEVTFDDNVTVKSTNELAKVKPRQGQGESVVGIQFRVGDPLLMIESGNRTCIVKPRTQGTPAIKPSNQTLLTQSQIKDKVLGQLKGETKRPVKSGHLRRLGPTFEAIENGDGIHKLLPGFPDGMPPGHEGQGEGRMPMTSPRPPKEKLYRRAFPKPDALNSENDETLAITGTGTRKSQALVLVDNNNQGQGFKGKKMRARSAGTVPPRARTPDHHKMLLRQQEMLRKSPATPFRTPPSIPSPFSFHGGRSPRGGGQYSMEHESHARKVRSPRHYMEKVGVLRKDYPPSSAAEDGYHGDDLTGSLSVVSMRIKSGAAGGPSPDLVPSGYPSTPVGSLEDQEGDRGSYQGMDPEEYIANWKERMHIPESNGALEHSPPVTETEKQRYIDVGRPIPSYAEVKDPDDYAEAVQMQKEAAAAVDIQKLFKGDPVPTNYAYLTKEERESREDEQKAAIEIQRTYRGHLIRKKQIEKRPPNQETLDWAKEYKGLQIESEGKRTAKAQEKARELADNKATAEARIEIIGPHVEVYAPFHPKKTGPDKAVLGKAATAIQRWVRGWLIRQRFIRIKRKAKQHASSWPRFIAQYKEMLRRIQFRAGQEKAQAPFDFQEVNEYMDSKKRYESVFERKAFGGEMEQEELMGFFKECDLYPGQMEVDDALHAVFRGQGHRKEGEGLQKQHVLEIAFQIYAPGGTGIVNARKSTWLNPIIDGEEAIKFMGTDNVESTDFKTVWNLVSSSKRGRVEETEMEDKKRKEAEHAKFIEDHKKPQAASPKDKTSTISDTTKPSTVNPDASDETAKKLVRRVSSVKAVTTFAAIGEEEEEEG